MSHIPVLLGQQGASAPQRQPDRDAQLPQQLPSLQSTAFPPLLLRLPVLSKLPGTRQHRTHVEILLAVGLTVPLHQLTASELWR